MNATAAAALAAGCGIPTKQIVAALKTFKSVKRRLEVRAQVNGITIIDDFAHHPTAIAGTLKALRERYAGRATLGHSGAAFEYTAPECFSE